MRILLPLLLAVRCLAAIDGTVMNGTINQPQANVIVSLMQPGAGGMQTLATTKSDAAGKFHFDKDPQGPRIIQALFDGVIYNQVAAPGTPTDNITVDVYASTRTAGTATLAQHLVLLQPSDAELTVSENYLFQNGSKLSFNDPANGSAKVYIPQAGWLNAKATITAPGGMPIQRDLEKTRESGVYKISYPLKPGETRFDVTYSMPAAKPMRFAGHSVDAAQPTRLVVPNGVSLTGSNLQLLGQEPTTQASIYTVSGDKYEVEVVGTGSMAPQQPANPEDLGMPQPHAAKPRLYDRIWLLLGLVLSALAVGAFLLYRRETPK